MEEWFSEAIVPHLNQLFPDSAVLPTKRLQTELSPTADRGDISQDSVKQRPASLDGPPGKLPRLSAPEHKLKPFAELSLS